MKPSRNSRQSASTGDGLPTELTVWTVLQTVATYIRRRPHSLVPLTVAGLIVAVADWIRTTDPIPMMVPNSFRKTVSVQYSLVPMGTHRTVRSVDALINLRAPYLVGAVGLELVVLGAVASAGYLTLKRVLDTDGGRSAMVRYGMLVTAVGFLPQWLGTPDITLSNLLIGLVAIVLVSVIAIRLFLLPGLVVAGESFRTALRQSRHRSRGIGWTLFGLIVVFGITSWGLAQIPIAGGFLSTALVAPVQAISVAVLIRRTGHRG